VLSVCALAESKCFRLGIDFELASETSREDLGFVRPTTRTECRDVSRTCSAGVCSERHILRSAGLELSRSFA
jgi:hypothetical protein